MHITWKMGANAPGDSPVPGAVIEDIIRLAVLCRITVTNASGQAVEPIHSRVNAKDLFEFSSRLISVEQYKLRKCCDDDVALAIARAAYRIVLRTPDLPGGATQAIAMIQSDISGALVAVRNEINFKHQQT